MSTRHGALVLVLLGLAGCTVGPDFTQPAPKLPASWTDASTTADAASGRGTVTTRSDPDPRWWTSFDDTTLTRLVDRAVAGNLDLQAAVMRIAEARTGEATARAAGLPDITANGSYKREQLGLKGLLEQHHADQFAQQSPEIASFLQQATKPVDLFRLGFDASWELDLFGRVRRSVEQATAQTAAAIESRNDALVSLEAEVAQTYARLRGAQANTQIAGENVTIAKDLLQLTQRRRAKGLVTDLDVENATAQLTTTEAQLPQHEQQATQAINTLAVLTGALPGTLDAELAVARPMPPAPPDVPVGLPASLVRRRPDIREAEAELHAQTAGVGVAVAQLFPDVSLTGSFGARAEQAKYLANWASHFYSFGPNVSLPIFEGGKLTANVDLAKAEQAEAAINYQKTVLNALDEVENALVAYRTDQLRRKSLIASEAASRIALTLARDRYEHGLSSYIDVLDAQRTLTQALSQLIETTLAVTTDLVALYKALGGGWEAPPAA